MSRLSHFCCAIENLDLQITLVFTRPSEFPKGPHKKNAEFSDKSDWPSRNPIGKAFADLYPELYGGVF